MNKRHHSISKRLESNQQVDVADTYVSGGFICDLSVKFNPLKLPLNDHCYTKSGAKPHKQVTPVICKDLRKYVRRFMRGLSKQELSKYIVQLLLDCPQESPLSESVSDCSVPGCTLHCSPDFTQNPHNDFSNNLPSGQNRPSSVDRRNKPSDHQHKDARENMGGSNIINQNPSRGTQDQSFLNYIISAIDLLCDMRALFVETIQESQEKTIGDATHIENKVVQSTDKKSRPRLSDDGRFQECVVRKRNKRVQTEGYLNNRDENQYNRQSQEYDREHVCSRRGLEDQANSYDRFINNCWHHQTPSPLIPPRANLQTY